MSEQSDNSNRKPVEQWAIDKQTEDWAFGAARAAFGWARGRELSAEEYDQAIAKAIGAQSSDGNPHEAETQAKPSAESGPQEAPRVRPTSRRR